VSDRPDQEKSSKKKDRKNGADGASYRSYTSCAYAIAYGTLRNICCIGMSL